MKKSLSRLIGALERDTSIILSEADKKFKRDLEDIVRDVNSGFNKIDQVMMTLKKGSEKSQYEQVILESYEFLEFDYHARMPYKKLNDDNKLRLTQVKAKAKQVVACCKSKKDEEYKLAEPIALESLKLATLCCSKNSSELATAYCNYGKVLYYNKKFEDAKRFLKIYLDLSQHTLSKEEIQKTENLLKECDSKLIISPENSSVAPVYSSPLSKVPKATNTDGELLTSTSATVTSNTVTTVTTISVRNL